jgi:molybdate transport system substrate-binding protein
MEPSMQSKGRWIELDAQLYTPIAQGVVLLKKNANGSQVAARRFYEYLFTNEAKQIFNTYGYKLP